MNDNIVKKVCKELGISEEKLDDYPTLKQVLQEYDEQRTFQKVLQRMLGVDRVFQGTKFVLQ